MRTLIFLVPSALVVYAIGLVSSSAATAGDKLPNDEAIRKAAERALPWLERSAHRSRLERKQCFTCHNQGLPVMALTLANERGFPIDTEERQAQLAATAAFLNRNRDGYLSGKGQAGQVFMAGYALWSLEYGDWPADDTTAAVAEYFLKYQPNDDHWHTRTNRPPSEFSPFAATFLALNGLSRYGTAEQQPRISARRQSALTWLQTTPADETEDRVFRLWGLRAAGAPSDDLENAVADLKDQQHRHGGWSQRSSMTADPYATATSLVALQRAGDLSPDDPSYRRGLRYLIDTQSADGTWHVVSRSKPFQSYYESGYPYGDDQFISITAASWATMALCLALPEISTP